MFQLKQQGLAILGLGSAVAGGRATTEVAETVVDTAVQEATGLPVGPSALRKPGSQVEGPEPPHRPKQSPETSPHREPDKPPDAEREPTSLGHRDLEYWTKNVEFEGQKIYQRNDLIDPNLKDSKGRTNLERMQAGLAPVTSDYDSISLHHLLQESGHPLAEVKEKFHREHRRILHINPPSIPSGIERDAFDSFRRRYWRQRAIDFGGSP